MLKSLIVGIGFSCLLLFGMVACLSSGSNNATSCTSNGDCLSNQACVSQKCVPILGDAVVNVPDTSGTDSGGTDSGGEDTGGRDLADSNVEQDQTKDQSTQDGVQDQGSDWTDTAGDQDDDLDPGDTTDQQSSDTEQDQTTDAADAVTGIQSVTAPLADAELKAAPNGTFAVILADVNKNGARELFLLPLGGKPVKLVGTADSSDGTLSITSFQIGPKSNRVVFRGDIETDGIYELYSIGIGETVPTKLSPIGANLLRGVTDEYVVTSGGTVIFSSNILAPNGSETEYQYFHGPISGNEKSVPVLDPSGGILIAQGSLLKLTHSESRAVFYGRPTNSSSKALYSVDSSGSSIQISGLTNKTTITGLKIAPVTNRVVFRLATGTINPIFRLYTTAVDSNETKVLSHNETGDEVTLKFQISPLGTHVIFEGIREIDDPNNTGTDIPVKNAYLVPIDGSTAPSMMGPPAQAISSSIKQVGFSGDGKYALFVSDNATPGVARLYSAPVNVAKAIALTNNSDDGTGIKHFVSAGKDHDHVIFVGALEKQGILRLYGVPAHGGTVVVMSSNKSGGDESLNVFGGPFASPDGLKIMFDGDLETDNQHQIYVLDTTTGETATVYTNPKVGALTKLFSGPAFTANSKWLYFAPIEKVAPNTSVELVIVNMP